MSGQLSLTEGNDNDLIGNPDARLWAERFANRFVTANRGGSGSARHTDTIGLMLAWFACAIETGRMAQDDKVHACPDSGHEIARAQLKKHGKDRYPTAWQQWRKVLGELGELVEAMSDDGGGSVPSVILRDRIKSEYADVGLALYELGNKLGLDLIECMRELVEADQRNFAPSAATQAYGATGCT